MSEITTLSPRVKIGLVSQGDPSDPRTFSGIARHILKTLRSIGPEIVAINSEATTRWELREARLHRLLGGRPADWLTLSRIFVQSKRVQAQLDDSPVDLLITTGTTHLAFVKPRAPLIVWNDAVFPSLVNYYDSFTRLTPSYRAIGRWSDSSVTKRACEWAYSSEWAATEAKRHYRLPEKRVSTIPFGPCLDQVPERKVALAGPENHEIVRLLFVGKDWHRKGGPSVVSLAENLRKRGIVTEVDLVGCNPPDDIRALSFVRSHGFLGRTNPKEGEKLDGLFRKSHFLVVPSKAECCAQVYLEAAAYGLPVVARDTGGTATAVRHGKSGFLLNDQDAGVAPAADWVQSIWSSAESYLLCRRSARSLYESTLNWKKAAENLSVLVTRSLARRVRS